MSAPTDTPTITERRPFGIIGAMDLEVETLKAAMVNATAHTFGPCEFICGSLDGAPCVIVQCGVGMVNAAACTQALIDRFAVSCVVNTGVAGSLTPSVGVGDMVIATDAVNWMMDVQNLGYDPGQTPGLPSASLPTSKALGDAAVAAAQAEGAQVHRGRIASGDRFVRETSERTRIAGTFDAVACEMEGAAIAQVCLRSDVPCAILRAISDTADGANAIDYPTFEATAARQCAAITRRLATSFAAAGALE